VRADAGIRAHPFCDGKAVLEKPIQRRLHRASVAGELPGLFDLTKDLRLAQHERIQSGGDAEQVANCRAVDMLVKTATQQVQVDLVLRCKPFRRYRFCTCHDTAVNLGTVAGRDDTGFKHPIQSQQTVECLRQMLARHRDARAQVD